MNHAPADHNLVTWVHQLEVGERRAAPLGLTPPGGFLATAEGRLTAASLSLNSTAAGSHCFAQRWRWVNDETAHLVPKESSA